MNDFLSWQKHRHIIVPVLIFLGLLFFSAALLPSEPVWITDNGNKLMIMHNFAAKGTVFFEHPAPGNFPTGGFHFQTLADGRIVSFHSPFLPVLSAWISRLAGNFAAVLIPMLCGAGVAAFLLCFPGKKWWLLAAAAATPMLFYSLLPWEMIPAALAVTAAAWYFFRRRFTLAGAIFSLGLWMREELYLLGAILLLILLCRRQWKVIWQFALGAILPATVLWAVNWYLFGNIAGIHGSTYFVNNRTEELTLAVKCREVIFNFYHHLVRFESLPKYYFFAALATLLPALIAGFAPGYRKWRKFKVTAGTIFVFSTMIFAVMLWKQKAYLYMAANTFGLFISVPPLLGFLLNYRALLKDKHKNISIAAWLVCGYILTIPLLLNPNDIGLTWGARHFIMLLPLMLFLSIYAWRKCGFFHGIYGTILFGASVVAGCIMQIYALNALIKVTSDTEFFQSEILSLPQQTVVSDLFFIPEMTPMVPFAKTQLEIADQRQLDSALEYLEKEDIQEFILILSPDYRRITNPMLAELIRRYTPISRPVDYIIGNSLRFYVVVCRRFTTQP